jgi:hypothetical protein
MSEVARTQGRTSQPTRSGRTESPAYQRGEGGDSVRGLAGRLHAQRNADAVKARVEKVKNERAAQVAQSKAARNAPPAAAAAPIRIAVDVSARAKKAAQTRKSRGVKAFGRK